MYCARFGRVDRCGLASFSIMDKHTIIVRRAKELEEFKGFHITNLVSAFAGVNGRKFAKTLIGNAGLASFPFLPPVTLIYDAAPV